MVDINRMTKEYKIFADTCSLLHHRAKDFFWGKLLPALSKYDKNLIVPLRVIEELDNLEKRPEKKKIATEGKKILSKFQNEERVDIRGEKSDPFADNVFQVVFTKFLTRYNMVLITQDKSLALDILGLIHLKSISFGKKKVKVYKINRFGNLDEWRS